MQAMVSDWNIVSVAFRFADIHNGLFDDSGGDGGKKETSAEAR